MKIPFALPSSPGTVLIRFLEFLLLHALIVGGLYAVLNGVIGPLLLGGETISAATVCWMHVLSYCTHHAVQDARAGAR